MSFIEQSHRKAGLLTLMLLSLLCSLTASAQTPTTTNQHPADNEYLEGAVLWQQTAEKAEKRKSALKAY